MDLKKYFIKAPLIPAVVQDTRTKKVLMLAYMNEESLKKTLETGYTWFYSRSRQELWNKGATSGHVQKVISIMGDCDDDTLLVEVEQTGPACHTGNETCFYQQPGISEFPRHEEVEAIPGEKAALGVVKAVGALEAAGALETLEIVGAQEASGRDNALGELYQVVLERKKTFCENSYTCYLFEKGLDKILKKCGEECSEVIIAAKNATVVRNSVTEAGEAADGDRREEALEDLKNEICDLLYHLTVLMVNEGVDFDGINGILKERSRKIGNLKTFRDTDHSS